VGLEFERSVLRELDQIHRLIQDVVTELRSERDTREALDTEVSELKLKVDRLIHRPPRHKGRAMARDGGLVVSTGTLLALINWWVTTRQPPPAPQHFPAPTAQTVPSVLISPVTP
jgi:hypothetical protein